MACHTSSQKPFLTCHYGGLVDSMEALIVYFTPHSGKDEVRVVDCLRSENLECNFEPGFNIELKAPNYAEIKLPESFEKVSGSFRCQIPGMSTADVKSCLWPPTDIIGDLQLNTTSSVFQNMSSVKNDLDLGTTEVIIGSVVGVLCFIFILIVICILMKRYKNRMSTKGVSFHAIPNSSKKCEVTEAIDNKDGLKSENVMLHIISPTTS